MDPNSPEAVAWLNNAYNTQTHLGHAVPEPAPAPEAVPPAEIPEAPAENVAEPVPAPAVPEQPHVPEQVHTEPEQVTTSPETIPSEAPATEPTIPEPVVPTHETPSAPVESIPEATPVAEPVHAAPESTHLESPTSDAEHALGSFVNHHNIRIESNAPHAYLYEGPDGKPMLDAEGNNLYAIYGGTGDEPFKAANEFLRDHPGASVRFELAHKDIITGSVTKRVLELTNHPGVGIGPGRLNIEGEPLPIPNPESFTQEVPFTFVK